MYVGRHMIAVIPFWGKTDPAYLHGLKVNRLSFVELRKTRLFALKAVEVCWISLAPNGM